MALTKEEAVLMLVIEMAKAEDRDGNEELLAGVRNTFWKECSEKVDMEEFKGKIRRDEATKEDIVNALKQSSRDFRLNALVAAFEVGEADCKWDESEKDLIKEIPDNIQDHFVNYEKFENKRPSESYDEISKSNEGILSMFSGNN